MPHKFYPPIATSVDDLSGISTVGLNVAKATDAAAARAAIGAGTSNLALGTTSGTAKAGDYQPTWAQVTSKPAVIAAGATAADARTAIAAKADSYVPAWSEITSKPAVIAAGADAAAARAAIGAGTSNLAIGTTSTTAKAGDYQPTWAQVSGKPAFVAAGATQTEARDAIGAGTSSLQLGTTSTTAKAGDYQPTAANISDASTIGRSILTAANAAAVKTQLALVKADVGLSNVDNTADANKSFTKEQITNFNSFTQQIFACENADDLRALINIYFAGLTEDTSSLPGDTLIVRKSTD